MHLDCVETLLLADAIAFGSLVFRGLNGSKIITVNEDTLSVHDRRKHQTPYGVLVCKQTSKEILKNAKFADHHLH